VLNRFDDLLKALVVVACFMVAVPVVLIGSVVGRMVSQAMSGECVEIPMTLDSCHFDRTFSVSIDAAGVVDIFVVLPDGSERLVAPSLKNGSQKMDRWLPMPVRCLPVVFVARDHAGHELSRRDRTCWGDVWAIADSSP
jgi:hypothetical protein